MDTDKREERWDAARASRFEHDDVTEKIIGCAFTVLNVLGPGFLEKVYENALVHELRKAGVEVEQQFRVSVTYDGVVVGEFIADMLVERRVLVELKAAKGLDDAHIAQALNYLTATSLKTCLLLNFGLPNLGIKRVSR